MINLLPRDQQDALRYARSNVKLAQMMLFIVSGTIGILCIMAFGYLYLDHANKNIEKQIAGMESQLKEQKLVETQKRVGEISSSLKLVLQVLGKEILFSKLIQQIGSAIPPGTTLTDLRLNKISSGGGIDMQFVASNYQTGTQIQINLQDPANKIFEKADIVTINCTSGASADPLYPCTVTVRAQFAKNNPYVFVQNSSTAVKP